MKKLGLQANPVRSSSWDGWEDWADNEILPMVPQILEKTPDTVVSQAGFWLFKILESVTAESEIIEDFNIWESYSLLIHELNVMTLQCLARRLGSLEEVSAELACWEKERKQLKVTIKWQFTTKDACVKPRSLYPNSQDGIRLCIHSE